MTQDQDHKSQDSRPRPRPKNSVLRPRPRLNITALFLNHHLCVDDAQFFSSFHPSDVHSSITFPWRSAADLFLVDFYPLVLTLNSLKLDFFIGLQQQLAKLQNISTTHSARNPGFIFDENLTLSDQTSSLSRSCYYHIRQLRCICPYLDFKTSNAIATSLYTPSLATITLYTLTLL